jgi:thiamine-phosphate pyrophosphorylase
MKCDNFQIFRIIDVNVNRATEGLRVVEEWVRFELEDKQICSKLREIRYRLAKLINKIFKYNHLIESRDSKHDIGLEISVKRDREDRKDIIEIIKTNIKRAQEAVRVLEEYTKIISTPYVSRELEVIRYQIYGLEEDIISFLNRRVYFQGLYLILDYGIVGDKIWNEDYVKRIITAGVDIVQLRAKNIFDKQLITLGNILRKLTDEVNIPLIINDRIDIAVAVKADGVHLGLEDIPVKIARRWLKNKVIGMSAHSILEAEQAEIDGADYIGFGPIYTTTTKKDAGEPIGVEVVRDVLNKVSIPVIPIGGITLDNIHLIINTGIKCVAIGRGILGVDKPEEMVKKMKEILHGT